jgi:hypothetical protein
LRTHSGELPYGCDECCGQYDQTHAHSFGRTSLWMRWVWS